jgi:hypothetical protein
MHEVIARIRRTPAPALLLAAAITLGACGSSSSASVSASVGAGAGGGNSTSTSSGSASGSNDACAFIDSASAKAILGVDVAAGKVTAQVPYPNCLVSASDPTSFANVSVTVFHGAIEAQGVISGASQLKATVSIANVGDQALRSDDGAVIVSRKGDIGCEAIAIHAAITSPDALAAALGQICVRAFAAG